MAARIVASAYGFGAPWTTRTQRLQPFTGDVVGTRVALGVATFILLAAAVVLVATRRSEFARPLARLVVMLAVAVPVEIYAVQKISGPAYSYLVQWLWVFAAATWFALVWVVASRWHFLRPALAVVTGAYVIVFVVANLFSASGAPRPDGGTDVDALRALVPAVVTAARIAPGPVVVRGTEIRGQAYASGLQLQLLRRGIDALAPDTDLNRLKLTPSHLDRGGRARSAFTVVADGKQALYAALGYQVGPGATIDRFRADPAFHELASVRLRLDPSEQRALRDSVAHLRSAGTVTAAQAEHILAADGPGWERFAVFESDAVTPLPSLPAS